MSLPPALLQRLAQRGLVQKQKSKLLDQHNQSAENEEVIAEDYDEMESADPSQYPDVVRKPAEENFWLERMRARVGFSGSTWSGYKGCPNKYNIWHKCTLFCVNRWAEGRTEPSRDYLKRYKRLKKKYPLPKGWSEMYDPGCGCFYFCNANENLVSWLPPTHPKSQVTKSAATIRRQMDEQCGGDGGSDGDQHSDDDGASDASDDAESRHHREVDEIITATLRAGRRSPPTAAQTSAVLGSQDFPSLQEAFNSGPPRKPKNRDLERTISRQNRRERDGRHQSSRRQAARDANPLDPMDPSSYSDLPRGSWSDGLNTERKKATEERKEASPPRKRYSDDDERDDNDDTVADKKPSKGRRRRSRHSESDGSHDDEHDDYE